MAATQAPTKNDTKAKEQDEQATEPEQKAPAEKPARRAPAQAHITAAQRKALGNNLRKARESKGVSQNKFAEQTVNPKSLTGAPWHYTYIGNSERGNTLPSQDFVKAVAEFAGVSIESLLPDGVKLSDLTEGVTRAPRGSKKTTPGRRTQAQPSLDGAGEGRRRAPNTTVGISSDGEQVTITIGEARVTLGGEFDASISGGKLHVG